MPYSDNSAVDIILVEGKPVPGPSAPVNLAPYNRLLVVFKAQGCQGTMSFEGSIDGETWFDLALQQVDNRQMDISIALGTAEAKAQAYSMMLQDSAVSHFRINNSANTTGGTCSVKARKENS